MTAKQRKIGRNRPTCPTTNPSAKLAAFSDRGGGDGDEQDYRHHDHPDFDGWGGSHAGSVNTGMEIEEKLSGGSKPPALLSSGPLFRSCTALATSISHSTVAEG